MRASARQLSAGRDVRHQPMQEPPPVEKLLIDLSAFIEELSRKLALADVDWQSRKQAGEWTLTEVVCHLRDVECEVHQPRLAAMIRENDTFLPGAVADEWVEERHYARQDGRAALNEFIRAREQTIALLDGVTDEMWNRQAHHAFFGPTTMHELLYLMVQHDEAHWEQINEILTA